MRDVQAAGAKAAQPVRRSGVRSVRTVKPTVRNSQDEFSAAGANTARNTGNGGVMSKLALQQRYKVSSEVIRRLHDNHYFEIENIYELDDPTMIAEFGNAVGADVEAEIANISIPPGASKEYAESLIEAKVKQIIEKSMERTKKVAEDKVSGKKTREETRTQRKESLTLSMSDAVDADATVRSIRSKAPKATSKDTGEEAGDSKYGTDTSLGLS